MKSRPLLIVLTPVRNEAWVLRAFLKATSLWADYIIIADQMSTDGSRDIYKSYNKVIFFDNVNLSFNEAERQKMLVDKAREVAAGRDCLLWALDADEILAANAFQTVDWGKIMNSNPGDVFLFKWAEINPNKSTYGESTYYPWLFHDDRKEPHGNYVTNMHSMRIPYPIEEKQMYYVNDFKVLHLAYMNSFRTRAKLRFYQFVDWEINKRSIIQLSRSYSYAEKALDDFPLKDEMIQYDGFDLFKLIDNNKEKFWFDEYIILNFKRHSKKDLAKLDIWSDEFLKQYGEKDPRNRIIKLVHKYLHVTNTYNQALLIRIIDKVLKKLGL